MFRGCDVETLMGFDTKHTWGIQILGGRFFGESSDATSPYDRNIYIAATSIIVSPICLFLNGRHILLVGRWRRMLCAFGVETSVVLI